MGVEADVVDGAEAGEGVRAVEASRTRLRRHPERVVRERAEIEAILDEALMCHVGVVDGDMPVVIPSVFGRDASTLYVHGSSLSRFMRAAEADLCITVTLLDGLVLSRSAFGHSVNYRSVMLFGTGRRVTDPDEQLRALRIITEHIVPGRWDEVRAPSRAEVQQTHVIALDLDSVSAKRRSGPPVDPAADRALPLWAGELPLRLEHGRPVAAPGCAAFEVPESIRQWTRGAQ